MPQPRSCATSFFSHFTRKNEFYGPIVVKGDWEIKSSCAPRKTRTEQWCSLFFSVALTIEDDLFLHSLLVGMVWEVIIIDLLGTENKVYAFLLDFFSLALTSDFSSWDSCSVCEFALLQNGVRDPAKPRCFVGKKWES